MMLESDDILLIDNIPVVVVDIDLLAGYMFVAKPESYIMVEGVGEYVYGHSDSGYEKLDTNSSYKKIGHITLG